MTTLVEKLMQVQEAMKGLMGLIAELRPEVADGPHPDTFHEEDDAEQAIALIPEIIREVEQRAEWRAIDSAPKGAAVLVFYLNRCGKGRVVKAVFVPKFTEEANMDSDWHEYDEKTDSYYTPEGWYEQIDNWGDFSACHICEGAPTHWMPLPAPPGQASPAQPEQQAVPSSDLVEAEDDKLHNLMLAHLDGVYLLSTRPDCDQLVSKIIRLALSAIGTQRAAFSPWLTEQFAKADADIAEAGSLDPYSAQRADERGVGEDMLRSQLVAIITGFDPFEPFLPDGSIPAVNEAMEAIRPYLRTSPSEVGDEEVIDAMAEGIKPHIRASRQTGKLLSEWFCGESALQALKAAGYGIHRVRKE